jgi:catecholate siderophore receptor
MGAKMSGVKVPGSLRMRSSTVNTRKRPEVEAGATLTTAFLMAAGSVSAAEAQQATGAAPALAPVTVTAPVAHHRHAAAKPTKAHLRARTALRHKLRETTTAQSRANPGGSAAGQTTGHVPGSDPYANPNAPYQAERFSPSKFSEPIFNTPRSVTVLTQQVMQDKNLTSLRDIGRTTAGVTLGSGEGGNAFGDRFFVRGFDVRNDIFVDGIRDPGVSIRENFFTEEVEILRGPASTYAGRGTSGGAINIVTKQAEDDDFYTAESQLASDQTRRFTFDVNKAISPILDVRLDGLIQGAGVAGRDFTTDNRNGLAGALTFRPLSNLTIKADYSHTYLSGLPDFGVPYNLPAETPVTNGTVPRDTYYGIINRDFTKTTQNIGTIDLQYHVNDIVTLENKMRQEYSILNYIGTIPENPAATVLLPAGASGGCGGTASSTPTCLSGYTQLNAQSRFETVAVLADDPQANFDFYTGPVKNSVVFGGDFDHERISINTYNGLTSEGLSSEGLVSSTGAPVVSIYDPTNFISGLSTPTLGNNPQIYNVDTKAVYLLETANYNDLLIANAGVRFDNYQITSSNNVDSSQDTSNIPTFNVGLVYKPIPITSLYAAYATAADPVGDELDATASSYGGLSPTQPPAQIFGPQRSQAIEVGNKWELFDRRLLVSGALFQTNVENARESTPAGLPNPAGGVYATNTIVAGAAYRVRGIDLEATGKITDKWSLMGGLVLMNSDITQSVVPHDVGLQLANIAHQSFNLLTKYQFTDWFDVGGQAVWESQIFGGSLLAANGGVAYNQAPDPTVLPSHWRFDGFVEAKIGPYSSLKLYCQNIFNRTYYDSIYQSGVPFIRVAPGRTVSLIADVKF